jgi:hypothetical protein
MDLYQHCELSDVRIVCADSSHECMYFSKFALAFKFEYFHSMFVGGLQKKDDVVHLEFTYRTMELLIMDQYGSACKDMNTEQVSELLTAMSFLGIKKYTKIHVSPTMIQYLRQQIFPSCESYVNTESLETYANTLLSKEPMESICISALYYMKKWKKFFAIAYQYTSDMGYNVDMLNMCIHMSAAIPVKNEVMKMKRSVNITNLFVNLIPPEEFVELFKSLFPTQYRYSLSHEAYNTDPKELTKIVKEAYWDSDLSSDDLSD